jgi:hypothetical protein
MDDPGSNDRAWKARCESKIKKPADKIKTGDRESPMGRE